VNSARSWVVFAGGVLVYLVGITQRTSFGIAGVDATERFAVTAAAVSSVAVAQVVVYAGLQIPVGLLLDRWGSRRLLLIGAAVMAIGQTLLAFSEDVGPALVARILVGAGDAATFVSVVRLLPAWFSGPVLPQLTQWLGVVGQLGQIVSALPFAFLLHSLGWRPAFLLLAGLAVVMIAVILTAVSDGVLPVTGPIAVGGTGQRLLAAIRRPGTQLGFWAHMAAGTPASLIAILWGYPYLTAALGYPIGTAAFVMSMLVVGNLVAGPIIGWLIARYPLRRSNVVLSLLVLMYGPWAVVLAWPGQPPFALVVALFVVLGIGGPGSVIGFDYARTFNPTSALGSASGVVNVGGFLGAFVSMFAIGAVLDAIAAAGRAAGGHPELYALDAFRIAFLVPFAVSGLAVVGLLVARRRTRRLLFAEQGISVAPLWVALFRRHRRHPGR
jgi:MFS family permease